jgi:hypothetical protein
MNLATHLCSTTERGKSKLGLDVGRVLIAPADESSADTSFIRGSLDDALRTPPYEGMFDVVPRLVEKFAGEVWIVSKCGPNVQSKTIRWLEHNNFFERTEIPKDNVRFCLKRSDKALHCKELGITHFIDDRIDVLMAMVGIVPNLYLFGPQRSSAQIPPSLRALPTWQDATAISP